MQTGMETARGRGFILYKKSEILLTA